MSHLGSVLRTSWLISSAQRGLDRIRPARNATGLCATQSVAIGALNIQSARSKVEKSMATAQKQDFADQLDPDYRPDASETFMNSRQLGYFRQKLQRWKDEILRESMETLETLQNESMREPDVNDRASSETDWSLELRTRDRQRKLIAKIDAALRRIDDGEYGFCEVTGEPIALARLEARPIATMTVEAQERHERNEKISRDE
jgi:DnaK suppressor protein